MRAFDLDRTLVDDYATFSRSFGLIRAFDLRAAIDATYAAGRFWPDALLSINPRFEQGPDVAELASKGELDPSTADVFRIEGAPLRFYITKRKPWPRPGPAGALW